LTIGTDGTTNWTGLTTNSKTIDAVSYTYRLQTGGGGANSLPSYIPATRYLSFKVSGTSTINIGLISSSSSLPNRTLIICNAEQTKVDSIVNINGTTAATYTYNYTGGASTIYLYSRSGGINYYYLSVTNIVAALNPVLSDKGVSFNGSEIVNNQGLNIEVYNVIGKKVATSKTSISTANFQKGVYVVRATGFNDSLKIII